MSPMIEIESGKSGWSNRARAIRNRSPSSHSNWVRPPRLSPEPPGASPGRPSADERAQRRDGRRRCIAHRLLLPALFGCLLLRRPRLAFSSVVPDRNPRVRVRSSRAPLGLQSHRPEASARGQPRFRDAVRPMAAHARLDAPKLRGAGATAKGAFIGARAPHAGLSPTGDGHRSRKCRSRALSDMGGFARDLLIGASELFPPSSSQ